jgi:hypothetical protein
MDPVTLSTIVKGCLTHIEHLEFIIAQMRRREFGRRSEKVNLGEHQLNLGLDGPKVVEENGVKQSQAPARTTAVRPCRKSRALPEHLRRETQTHLPQQKDCPDCGRRTEEVERIATLYQIEKEIRGRHPEQRRAVRISRARPLLESMRSWLEASLGRLAPKSDTSSAIHYALARLNALSRYVDDSRRGTAAMERRRKAVASRPASRVEKRLSTLDPVPSLLPNIAELIDFGGITIGQNGAGRLRRHRQHGRWLPGHAETTA